MNQCSGYLSQHIRFTPNIRAQCPELEDENLADLGITPQAFDYDYDEYNACLDQIESQRECTIGRTSSLVEDICNDVIREYTTYNSCVDRYKDTSDFLLNEWYIYLTLGKELWREKRELIQLIDTQGKIVDTMSY